MLPFDVPCREREITRAALTDTSGRKLAAKQTPAVFSLSSFGGEGRGEEALITRDTRPEGSSASLLNAPALAAYTYDYCFFGKALHSLFFYAKRARFPIGRPLGFPTIAGSKIEALRCSRRAAVRRVRRH